MDTHRLVDRAKHGDQEALLELISAQRSDYYKLAYVFTKNREDALDALEDMIVILYESIGRLKKDEAFFSWSKTILVNCCKKILRQRKKVVSLDNRPEEVYEDTYQTDELGLLETHLTRLSEKHQEVLRLRYFLDLDYQTIANILKIPVGTVKSRISNGLKKLQDSLGVKLDEGY